jgi:hypothetical protein
VTGATPAAPRDAGVRVTRTPKRPKRERETPALVGFFRRLMRAYTRRIADTGDLDSMAAFARLLEEGDGHLHDMVAVLRHEPWNYSWQQIGDALGITRSSAQERFRKAGGSRRAGGQPAHLR